jgi:hypothetical protein
MAEDERLELPSPYGRRFSSPNFYYINSNIENISLIHSVNQTACVFASLHVHTCVLYKLMELIFLGICNKVAIEWQSAIMAVKFGGFLYKFVLIIPAEIHHFGASFINDFR